LEYSDKKISKQEFSIAYNGKARKSDHTINIDALVPALTGISRLIDETNTQINGKQSEAKLLVFSDFEHKCFNINFELLVTNYETIKNLFNAEEMKDAKNILEWIGLLSSGPIGGFGGYGLLKYLEWRKGRKITAATKQTDKNGESIIAINVEGDNNTIEIHNHVYR
jgi:hypothetical protein